ncbi:MAG: hypothetical protein KatS3mg038_1110 [Candidatus Kapaibacterium sp.]|nr:MAG: hypothetical protein KatS3mg038_1110 [Candidatus Kapabacteria bacterium]
MVDNDTRDNSTTHCDLSVCVITTADDMHRPAFRRMLSSIPRGAELVVLLNHIGADSPVEHVADDEVDGVVVHLYRCGVEVLSLARLRNECARLATRTWCLWLDSDDVIVSGSIAELVRTAKPSVGAYYMQCVGMQSIDGSYTSHYSTTQIRLWRRALGDVWIGYAHEIINERIIKSAGYMIAHADVVIHHVGYVCDRQRQLERLSRNVLGVMRTLIEIWDSDDELRAHYARVLAGNLDMYNQLSAEQCRL